MKCTNKIRHSNEKSSFLLSLCERNIQVHTQILRFARLRRIKRANKFIKGWATVTLLLHLLLRLLEKTTRNLMYFCMHGRCRFGCSGCLFSSDANLCFYSIFIVLLYLFLCNFTLVHTFTSQHLSLTHFVSEFYGKIDLLFQKHSISCAD